MFPSPEALPEFYKTVTTAAIKVTEIPTPVIQRRVSKDHGCCTFVQICLIELTISVRSLRREAFGRLTGIVGACFSSLDISTLGIGGAGGGATGNSITAISLRSLAPSELIACTHRMFHTFKSGNSF